MRGPFTVEDARAQGLGAQQLHFGPWRRIAPSTYVWKGLAVTPELLLVAALRRLPEQHAFSGYTAAWLHGVEVAPPHNVEVTVPKGAGVSNRVGMRVSRAALYDGDVVKVRGYRATSVERTLRDISRRSSLTETVVVLDQALHAGIVKRAALESWIAGRLGDPGAGTLLRALPHAEPATESPMESRLRMLFVLGGLPRPEAQVRLHDANGRFMGRVDFYYREQRLAIEYDGAAHRASLVEDNRRQNSLLTAGIQLLRFTGPDIRDDPAGVVRQVRGWLHDRRAA